MINKYTWFLNRNWLCVNEENICLPHISWLPKSHKNPRKALFIIAALKCLYSHVLNLLLLSLKHFYTKLKATMISQDIFQISTFWTILNYQPVIKGINNRQKQTAVTSVLSFDFSTLHTNTPHDKLFKVLLELVSLFLVSKQKKEGDYITVDNYGAK